MPPTNLIVNGTFDAGNAGWSGNDLETNYNEGAYLGNGSGNRVAEMDGVASQTTVMEQSFVVGNPQATELTFDSALRTASNGNAGSEGFTAEVLDSDGGVIATLDVLPTSNSFTSFSLPVTFPSAGTYTVRLTELGPNDSLGAIIDNVELMVCFGGDTTIQTQDGGTPARDIKAGSIVATDRGPKQVTWVGCRHISKAEMARDPKLRPIKITAGALGAGLPKTDLWVSRQHRMLVRSKVCERMFGETESLIAACKLVVLPGIAVDMEIDEIDYVHVLFDEHQIVYAESAPTESLLLGPQAKCALSSDALEEVRQIFPELDDRFRCPKPVRFIPPPNRQKKLASRLAKNNLCPLDEPENAEAA